MFCAIFKCFIPTLTGVVLVTDDDNNTVVAFFVHPARIHSIELM